MQNLSNSMRDQCPCLDGFNTMKTLTDNSKALHNFQLTLTHKIVKMMKLDQILI